MRSNYTLYVIKCIHLIANSTNNNFLQHVDAIQELQETITTLKIETERYKNVRLLIVFVCIRETDGF